MNRKGVRFWSSAEHLKAPQCLNPEAAVARMPRNRTMQAKDAVVVRADILLRVEE
jgi:hypothetical protein